MKQGRRLTTEAQPRVARRAGVRREQERVREAWKRGLFAVRSAGSGAGTSAYPKPDLIVFSQGGVVDIFQCKTTRRYRSRYSPSDWEDEVKTARRLRQLGFQVRVWLDFTLFRVGRGASISRQFRIDGREGSSLAVMYYARPGTIRWEWTGEAEPGGSRPK